MWHDATAPADSPETSVSGDVRDRDERPEKVCRPEPADAKAAAFAEVVRLTAEIIRHTRASQELAAESLVRKAMADAAAVGRSFVMAEAIEAAGHSTSTHTLTCDRGTVDIVPIEKKA